MSRLEELEKAVEDADAALAAYWKARQDKAADDAADAARDAWDAADADAAACYKARQELKAYKKESGL